MSYDCNFRASTKKAPTNSVLFSKRGGQSHRGVSHRDDCQNRGRLRHMLEAVAGILVQHRTGSAEKATALTSVGEEADDIGKGSGRGERG